MRPTHYIHISITRAVQCTRFYYVASVDIMSIPLDLPESKSGDNEYVHIRCLIANIHRPKNVSRPPTTPMENGPKPLEIFRESPTSSDTERSLSCSENSELNALEEPKVTQRAKSNSFAGSMLAPPMRHGKKRRPSFLHLQIGGNSEPPGPLSAGPHLNIPRLSVTAPPGEQRRFSHGFAAFHGFALRRHSNTVCPLYCNV